MAFFGFGAFSSPVGQLVERATDNAASAGNLALHLEICDTINETDNGPKEAVAAIRKRLTGNSKNFHVINLTLTVLETCVKNCGVRFHSKVAQKDFLVDLMKVVSPKNNPPTIVKERILGLIQYWADAFQGKSQLSAVGELYEQLKLDGVEFPPIDMDSMAPVEILGKVASATAPQLQLSEPGSSPRAPHSQSHHQQEAALTASHGPIGPLRPEQVAKLLSEFDLVRKNIDIMNELLTVNEPGKENQEDSQLLDDLNRIVHSMQARVAGLIDRCTDEIVLESTLVINDDLNSLFVRYDRWLKNSAAAKAVSGQDSSTTVSSAGVATTSLIDPEPVPSASNISYPSLEDDPLPPSYEISSQGTDQLIDLGTEPAPPPPQDDIVSQLAQLGITSEAGRKQGTDEFDVFAQSRTAYSQTGSTYADNLVDQTVSLSAAVHGRQDAPSTVQNPYGNLTDWLDQSDLKPVEVQSSNQPPSSAGESATSAEFDQFLAQRASKGESLPRPRPQMQKEEERSDELFQL